MGRTTRRGIYLKEEEDTVGSKMLRAGDCLESDERNQHGHESSHHVEDTVRHVDLSVESSDDEEEDGEDWDDVNDESVATPSGHHVEVGEGSKAGPEDGTLRVRFQRNKA